MISTDVTPVPCEFNDTAVAYRDDRLIHEAFEEQARRTPNSRAVVDGDRSLTYAGLNRQANQVARYLRERGVRPDHRVGLCFERCSEMVVALLGILKAGGAYVPLDPTYPTKRLEYLINDAGPDLVVTRGSLRKLLAAAREAIPLDEIWQTVCRNDNSNLDSRSVGLTASHLAYVIYTSGSTGEPKGVAAEHHSMVNRIAAQAQIAPFARDDVCCHKTSIGFVDAVFEILGPLCYGRPLALAPCAASTDPFELARFIQEEQVTRLISVPSLARALMESAESIRCLQGLRGWTLSGEELRGDLLLGLRRACPKCHFVNLYGSSEVAADVTCYQADTYEGGPVPIGRPVQNARVYILNEQQHPVQIGESGEIYVSGAGLARGYLNRAPLTAERFTRDPFSSDPTARMFRTGDSGRWRPDGMIEYLGRNDDQVKIRGMRVELGEISAQLTRLPLVKDAAVIAREDISGEKQLVAYIVGDGIAQAPTAEEVRRQLSVFLPGYMLPSAFIALDCLPLTASGKLDRSSLPAPDIHSYTRRAYEAPLGAVEGTLAHIWQELLGIERVGREGHFFELGGHSLLSVRMLERLRRSGFRLEARQVYKTPLLAELAATITPAEPEEVEFQRGIPVGCEDITPEMLPLVELDQEHIDRIARVVPGGAANIEDIYPLAPLQEGMLFHHLLDSQGGDAYVVSTLLSVSSRDRLEDLIAALQAVIDRHDVLRTAVLWKEMRRPLQVVSRQVRLPVQQVALDHGRDPVAQLKDRMSAGHQRLALDCAPLMRLEVAPDPQSDSWYALLQTHHLVCDEESLETMLAEVTAHLQGRASELPDPVPFRNHVCQALSSMQTRDAQAFFRDSLGDVEGVTAPFGLLDVRHDGTHIDESRQKLDSHLASRLRAQARRMGVSSATLFHAAWALVVSSTSGLSDVVYGTVLLGRMHDSSGAERTLGMFINTLPLRVNLRGVTAGELVNLVRDSLVRLLDYEQASLAEAQRSSGMTGSAPLFTALLNYRHLQANTDTNWGSAGGIEVLATIERTNYPITLSVDDLVEDFVLTAQTDRRVDPQRLLGYVSTAVRSLVEALETSPQTPARALSVLPEEEKRRVVRVFNETEREYPRNRVIHELFEHQVARTPDAVAVVYEGCTLTYLELNRKANQLAHYLLERGMQIGEYVPLLMPRSLQLLIAQIAVLKCGGAYVPLDPRMPDERLAFAIDNCGARRILAEGACRSSLAIGATEWVDCVAEERRLEAFSGDDLSLGMDALCPAYVMYTSGSTGVPKGVIVPHRAVIRLVINSDYVRIQPSDCIPHASNPAFDASTFEIWAALLNGAKLLVVPDCAVLDGERFGKLLLEHRATVLWLTVGLLKQHQHALAEVFGTLRCLITGGDVVEPELARRVLQRAPPECLLNAYGPTECTTFSTTHRVVSGDEQATSIPIGRPIANTKVYILNGALQPLPIGVAGEIYIGGQGVALGYLGRLDLTNERFIRDSFATEQGARMYRTGDFGKWRSDGSIEYLGRNDDQVKIRGYRIELGEIEAQLARHPEVREGVVLARRDEPGERRLVAYVIPREAAHTPSAESLREHLKGALPEYMVPSAFVMLDSFPLTPNGKLDRRALPAPDWSAFAIRCYQPPEGEIEEILAGIWQDLLHVERVGRQDSFFELGGHSLLIVQMMERLSRVGLSAEVRRVFESPTLADLAGALIRGPVGQIEVPPNGIPPGCEFISPRMLPLVELEPEHIERIMQAVPGGAPNIQDIYPLAPLQEGMLFHHLLSGRGGDTYVLTTLLSVSSRERLLQLVDAFQAIVDRHDVLRTAILWEQLPRPLQVVYRHAALPVEEVTLEPSQEPETQVRDWMRPERQRIELRQAPLMRLRTAANPHDGKWYALLQFHHVICDHVTMEVVMAEMVALLRGSELPIQPLPYRNHVAQALAHQEAEDLEHFFRGKLGDVEESTAPFGVLDVHGDGSLINESHGPLDPDLSGRLREAARRMNVSSATLFHAAWALVVSKTSGRDDVVFGTMVLGRMRDHSGLRRTVGLFINTLPLRLRLQGRSLKELVGQTQRELVELLTHEQAPLVLAQRCSGVAAGAPVFTTLLNFRHSVPESGSTWTSAEGIELIAECERTNYPVTVSVDDFGEGFDVTVQTDRRIDSRRVLEYLRTTIESLIKGLEDASERPAMSLTVMPEPERRQVLELYNATHRPYSGGYLIHEVFEQQVARTPDAVAVEHEAQRLTYAQLNRRANQLARYLVGQGIGPGEVVGICIDRSPEMVVGLLGTLKAGGAYLPLDPSYPAQRLRQMLEDASPQIVLTETELMGVLPASCARMIALDEKLGQIAAYVDEDVSPADLGLTADSPVYVIYTSGSTGKPKGTAMRHRSMVNLVEWHRDTFGCGEGQRVLQFAALSFDVAFQEIFSTLCTGATLVLLDEWIRRDAQALSCLLIRQSIHRLFLPPLMLQAVAEYCKSTNTVQRALKDVITAGEQLRITPEVRDFFGRLTSCQLHNHYGPTETHVVTALTLTGDPRLWPMLPPIGRPIANTQIYVLNGRMQPAPIGVTGEVYIGGANVARGYLNHDDLTQQRFVSNPYSSDPGARLYRTGDLARWKEDGTLDYLGRNDDQVKIRGFRIELREIEVQLARHEHVREAAVVVREDIPGQRRLVACVTTREGSSLSPEDLRAHLKAVLPEYMVPNLVVLLDHMPLTPSGKLDRRALSAPSLGANVSAEYTPPRGEVEEILAGIWQEILCLERISRNDDFFELGGHSLLIVQMMERLRRVGLSAAVQRVFENPILADLASTLIRGAEEETQVPPNSIQPCCEQITPEMLPLVELEQEHIDRIVRTVPGGAANVQDIYPLAPLQEGILFHHLVDQRAGDTYVIPTLFQFSSKQTLDRFVAAMREVISRHDVLRTAVLWELLPRPVQVVYRQVQFEVEQLDLDRTRDLLEQIKELMKPECQRMDLRRAPLMRFRVSSDTSGDRWYALLQMHHVICDHESVDTLYNEIVALLGGHGSRLPEPVAYREHLAQALAYAKKCDAQTFFRKKLAEIDESTAPFGLNDVRLDPSRIATAQIAIEPQLARRIRVQAKLSGVSAATIFHAAWALVVACTTGRTDVVFGTVLLGRMHGSAGGQRVLGMFMNTLPLRVGLAGVSAIELIEITQRELIELIGNEQASLAVAQRSSSISGSAPLFSALLNYRHTTVSADRELEDFGIRTLDIVSLTNYPVTLSVDDYGEQFGLVMDTERSIDPTRVLAHTTTAIQSLVHALEEQSEIPALLLQVLPDAERREVLEGFNPVQQYQEKRLLHELFEEQAELNPRAVAATYEENSLTYGELNARANQLARHLREKGVGPEQLVGIFVERGLNMVVGLLGILKAGGAYLPLDPSYPADRVAYMLGDADPSVVLTQESLRRRLPETGADVVTIDSDWELIEKQASRNPVLRPEGLSSDCLAYVIYTSGSSGRPKGVMVEHRNVVRLFSATEKWFGFNEHDVWTLFHSFAFDFSVWELWGALLFGGRVVVVPQLTARSPREFHQLLCREGVTVLNQTPSAFAQLIEVQEQYANLRHAVRVVVFGGEALELRSLRPWVRRNGAERPRLINMYGITETTVHVTFRRLSKEEIESERGSNIGCPIPDLRTYLLDRRRQPVPIGVAGEIYVSGAGVARGYLKLPGLTAERFLPDPFSADPNARMYKTGDLGRWRPDGTLEYLGRNDEQVKIRGYRIELGEIESQLVRHSGVKEAVVLAREDEPGEKRLVGYVIAEEGTDSPSAETLREHLKGLLPEYMVPTAFVVLDRLPLTANGKLDRRALPAPELSSYASREYESPQGEVEEILAGFWESLLRVERVGRQDNFFELGGHSLLIVQLMERLRRVGLTATVRTVFESATMADLARALTRGTLREVDAPPNRVPLGCSRITPHMLPLVDLEQEHIDRIAALVPGGAANIQDIYTLAPLQEGMLFHHQSDSQAGDVYVLTSLMTAASRERLQALISALQAVIVRHDMLRTSIFWEQLPQPVQVVHREVTLPVEEVALDPDRDVQVQLGEWMRPEQQRMNLQQAPLMRLKTAAEPGGAKWYVLLQLHHVICDNVSLDSMLAEVISFLEGRSSELPAPVPYRRHVAEVQAHVRTDDARAFFCEKLGDVTEPTAPFGLLDVRANGSRINGAEQILEPELGRRVRLEARRLGVSAATLFHSAWALVVALTSARDDIVYGTVLLGRFQGSAGARRTLGMFINTLPLRMKLCGLTVRELIQATQRELIQLLGHEQASLAVAQRSSGVAGPTPLFTSLLNYRHGAVDLASDFRDREGVTLLASLGRTNYPVMLSVDELPDGFALTADTERSIDPQRLLGYMKTAVKSLVDALQAGVDTPALDLPVLPEDERHGLIRLLNATQAAYPKENLVHELFEAQAKRTPNAVAVLHEGRCLTYCELNVRANQVARFLADMGVGPDQVVGICVERSPEMLVGLLGIMKAGGGYLPLDPNYPAERLRQMVEDAGPSLVLTDSRLRGLLPPISNQIIALDEIGPQIARFAERDLAQHGGAGDKMVYAIYTSGSTGRPKATVMRHRSMVNLIEWHRSLFGSGEGQRVLQFAALSFDVAFQEIFSTLCTGGTLVLLSEWVRRDPMALTDLLMKDSIHRLFVPPLMLQSIAEYCAGADAVPVTLKHVITAGEQLRVSGEIREFFGRLHGCKLHNHYGPTETHVVTALTLDGDPAEWPDLPSIGRPIANTQVYVLNGQKQPVPIGVAGEIYVGGDSVAWGYLKQPGLTAERFLLDPFDYGSGARVYKTGDVGRWRPDGTLEYLGRNDEQVKIRGYRIELGEIEVQLARHAYVREAVVLAREDIPGENRLVAYVMPRKGACPAGEDLRKHLGEHLKSALPEFMVPNAFVILEKLPVTPSGKLDRRALPAPDLAASTGLQYEAPQGEVEQKLAELWQKLLRIERVGRHDNFFELGGHSLHVMKLSANLARRFKVALSVPSVFRNPTVAQLAAVVDSISQTAGVTHNFEAAELEEGVL
jgi:amino acid adenylation domain-containing protein